MYTPFRVFIYIKALENVRRKHIKMKSVVSLGEATGIGGDKGIKGDFRFLYFFFIENFFLLRKYTYMIV